MIPTSFSQLIGNDQMKDYLRRMIAKQAIGHALLFSGPEGIGKSLFAQVLAAELMQENDPNGNHKRKIEAGRHPDIHIYRPEGKLGLHSIQSLRQMCEEVYYPPFEANCKVFIIHEAERMLSYSANALLKTFEEPPPRTKIILLSRSHSALLPTILSRCATFHFQAISQNLIESYLKEQFQADEQSAKAWAALAQGSLGRAVHLAKRGGDANRTMLYAALSRGRVENYKALSQIVKGLVEEIEKNQELVQEEIRQEQEKMTSDKLTAQQKGALEKELDGLTAVALVQETTALFEYLMSWYRDLHLILLGGDRKYLINPDYEEFLVNMVQFGDILSLEQVQKVVAEAQLALQRSVSLTICLENLFLKLRYL